MLLIHIVNNVNTKKKYNLYLEYLLFLLMICTYTKKYLLTVIVNMQLIPKDIYHYYSHHIIYVKKLFVIIITNDI